MESLMKVGSILGEKGRKVITLRSNTSLMDVAKVLSDHGIGSIVIVDESEKVVGIVSERDIVRTLAKNGVEILNSPVSQCMTENVITCSEQETIDNVMTIMTSHRFRHMPVLENGQLVGIISIGDVVKTKIASAEMEAEAMREYIVASR